MFSFPSIDCLHNNSSNFSFIAFWYPTMILPRHLTSPRPVDAFSDGLCTWNGKLPSALFWLLLPPDALNQLYVVFLILIYSVVAILGKKSTDNVTLTMVLGIAWLPCFELKKSDYAFLYLHVCAGLLIMEFAVSWVIAAFNGSSCQVMGSLPGSPSFLRKGE